MIAEEIDPKDYVMSLPVEWVIVQSCDHRCYWGYNELWTFRASEAMTFDSETEAVVYANYRWDLEVVRFVSRVMNSSLDAKL